jgi:hypothetical protein
LREEGLEHAPFDHPGDEVLAPIWARMREVSREEADVIVAREIFGGLNPRAALAKLRETIRAWRPDILVRESVEFASPVAADAAGVPHVCVSVHVGAVDDRFLPLVAGPVDALRQEAGLPPDDGASLRAERVFTAFPASLDDTSDGPLLRPPFRVRMPGDAPGAAIPAWAPDDDARPLLYITFGTIAGSSPHVRGVYRTALDAIADLPARALLTTGRGMEAGVLGAIPANVHVEAWVPQSEVFPRVAAVLCHGGSGTVLGALAAGLPLVVVPMFADQPINARRVAAIGAGLALTSPDAGALRAAIERVLADGDLRRVAGQTAAEMAALPTVDDAVDVLVGLAGR